MEVDPRVWNQGGGCEMDALRDRTHYMEGDQAAWGNSGLDMNKQHPYYNRGVGNYHGNQIDRNTYYPEPSHAVGPDMTSCDTSVYGNGSMVPVAPSHGMYDTMSHQHYPNGPSAEMEHWHLQMMSQTDPFLALPMRDAASKRKRRRVISMEQRKAANIRERRRMYQLNEAFDLLRKRVPTFAYEKKLSRIETLKLAVTYIEFMGDLLEDNGAKCKQFIEKIKDNIAAMSDDESLTSIRDDVSLESPNSSLSPSAHKGNGDELDDDDDDDENEC